jgi:hypothetical protein
MSDRSTRSPRSGDHQALKSETNDSEIQSSFASGFNA